MLIRQGFSPADSEPNLLGKTDAVTTCKNTVPFRYAGYL